MQELLEKVKLDLRLKNSAIDSDITDTINACLQDLRVTAGVPDPDLEDPLIIKAVKLYCRANYKTDQIEVYQNLYNTLKASLSVAGEYGGRADDKVE